MIMLAITECKFKWHCHTPDVNALHRPRYLNTWSSFGGTKWGSGAAILEGIHHKVLACRLDNFTSITVLSFCFVLPIKVNS